MTQPLGEPPPVVNRIEIVITAEAEVVKATPTAADEDDR